MNLGPEQFADFYVAANGYPPFPWQKELVKQVVAHGGRWPAVLDLPTSAGKTSALDAAVFLLALEVTEEDGQFKPVSVQKRSAAVRTFFVVDRRIVVDEAGDKARKLARLLNAADGGPRMSEHLQAIVREQRRIGASEPDPLSPDHVAVLRSVAERLRAFGGEKALHVSVLRGGMYRDGTWAESPTQPTICLSTVDQVGSRLLFRGYGVSPYQRAVHAGLVGNDTLILVDEAHLSRPFVETLKAVEFYRSESWAEEGQHIATPFQVVVMSATAGESAEPIGPMAEEKKRLAKLELSDEDRENGTLKARLGATKRTRLEEVKGGSEDEEAREKRLVATVALVPPVSMEALSVPVWAVRKWLAMDTPGDVTDVEGEPDPDADDNRRRTRPGRPFLRWRGPDTGDRDKTKATTQSRTGGRDEQDSNDDDGSRVDARPRPCNTIVVPSTYGGCDKFGWNPGCLDPVADVADDCSWRAKRRPVPSPGRSVAYRVAPSNTGSGFVATLTSARSRSLSDRPRMYAPHPSSEQGD